VVRARSRRPTGQGGLGKRTFVNTLFAAPLLQRDEGVPRSRKDEAKIRITEAGTAVEQRRRHGAWPAAVLTLVGPFLFVCFWLGGADLVEKGFRLRLNVIEALGFGDFVDNTDR